MFKLRASSNSSVELISAMNLGGSLSSSAGGDSATKQARAIMDYSPVGNSEIELRMNEVENL